MRRIHLDTDIGGDIDDLCALAMLLGWADAELVGVTTCSDSGGLRAGLARHALRLAGWDGARVEELRLSAQLEDGVLSFPESPSGKPTRVVTGVDGPRLEREWVKAVRKVGRVE